MQIQVGIVIIVDETALAVLEHKVNGLVVIYAENELRNSLLSVQSYLMNWKGHSHWTIAEIFHLRLPCPLRHCLDEYFIIPTVWQPWRMSFYINLRLPWSKGHLIQINPPLIPTQQRKLELSLKLPSMERNQYGA